MTTREFLDKWPDWQVYYDNSYMKMNGSSRTRYFRIQCVCCGKEYEVQWNKKNRFYDTGVFKCKSCWNHEQSGGNCNRVPYEKRSEKARRGKITQGKDGILKAAKKMVETQTRNGSGWYSEESRRKAAESNNKNREARGNVWANESKWEQKIAAEYGGVCGLRVYCPLDGKTRWPDVVFPDGHVIQIDDRSHLKKSLTYEDEYDAAMLDLYGYKPLHLMLPHEGCVYREGYNSWRDIVVDYLSDKLPEEYLIMKNDSWYPR